MKWELDDNTSDGIRFLLVGAGSLLVLRLLYGGVLQLISPTADDALAAACAHFHNGYWITDAHVVVQHTGGGIGARLALAVVLSIAAASALALVVFLLAKAMRGNALPWAVRTLRIALVIPFCWWLYASLMRPPACTRFDAEGIVLTRHASILGELSLPWRSTEVRYAWHDVESFTTNVTEGGMEVSAIISGHGTFPLTTGTAAEVEEFLRQLWKQGVGAP